MASYEDAIRCPKCERQGVVESKHSAGPDLPRGTQAHVVRCMTELCKWYDTTWLVQVNPDGTVPDPTVIGRRKQFESAPVNTEELEAALQADLKRQQQPGGEIRF